MHGVALSLLFNWRRRMVEGSCETVEADDDDVSVSEVCDLANKIVSLT